MSPQRKKGRGGGGGKTMAPRFCPAIDSPDPLVPLKLTRERRASTTQLISATRSKQLKADGARASCADPSRVYAAEQVKVSSADQARVVFADQGKVTPANSGRHLTADQSRASSADEATVPAANQAKVYAGDQARSSSTEESKVSSANQTRVSGVDQTRVTSAGQTRVYVTEKSKAPAFHTGKVSTTEKARASSATRARVSSVESFRSLVASSRCATATTEDGTSGTHGSSRRMSTKLRAESRPRSSRASPSTLVPYKDPTERVNNEPSKMSSATLLARARSNCSNVREEGKKLAKISGTFPVYIDASKVDPSLSEKALSREPLRSLKNIPPKEVPTETVRWSTTTLPLSAQKGTSGVDCEGEGRSMKTGQTKHPATQHGRLSTGSCTLPMGNTAKYVCEAGIPSSRVLAKCRGEQNRAKDTRASEPVHQKKPEDTGSLSSTLHKRLALLEGKVSQISSEIQKTKEMLNSNDCANSADLLFDIQGKITSIEQAMSCKDNNTKAASMDNYVSTEEELQARSSTENVEGCRESFDSYITHKHQHPLQVPMMSEHEIYFKQTILKGSMSAPPKVSGLAYNQRNLEDRLFPHWKLLRNRLVLSEREMENNTSTHSNLPERTTLVQTEDPTNNKSDRVMKVLTSEQVPYINNVGPLAEMPLNEAMCVQSNSGHLDDKAVRDGSAKQMSHHETNAAYPVSVRDRQHAFEQAEEGCEQGSMVFVGDAKDSLECNESPLSNSIHENLENIAPDEGVDFEYDDCLSNQLRILGDKVATAGWYVSDGDAILLAHEDGCCSYHDVANMEEKAMYAAPNEIAAPLWNDCWLIRAAGSDGRSNKYIVAATAGNALDCGFCSWDFYSKSLAACHTEYQSTPPMGSSQGSPIHRSSSSNMQLSPARSTLRLPLSEGTILHNGRALETLAGMSNAHRHYSVSTYQTECCESPQWWYRPCGPLMVSAASSLKSVVLYDIRDGDAVMSWDTDKPIVSLDYSSPLQWRDKGKLALAEQQAISVWDVNTMDVQCLQYVQLPGKQISAFYLHNADAECSGGVRQRLSSSETEAYDGVCCTQNDINVLDFRVPNGIGICFSIPGQVMQSVFARGDMILTGGLNRESHECGVQQWSVRKAMPVCTYAFPASSSHYSHIALTQVWGSSSMVMAVNGNGLYIFKGWKEATEGICDVEEVKDVVGTQDLFSPSFDYSNSRVLLISKDRQAIWAYWPH